MTTAKISIIIPVLNEAAVIASVVGQLQTAENVEIIVVDGGSLDGTVEIVETLAVKAFSNLKLLTTPPGRAIQMNAGSQIATGDILLFLHADTQLPAGFDGWVRRVLSQPRTVAGAFELGITGSMLGLRWVEWGVKWRSHYFKMPYGDQAIFLNASTFWEVGGFPQIPIMEDFELVRQLQQRGRIAIAPVNVMTSGRRWQKFGVLQTMLINQILIIAYLLGVSPTTLANWYRLDILSVLKNGDSKHH